MPEPKESGRTGSPQEQLDVNVYASDDGVQYDTRQDADEQHDADDGDDEEDDHIYEARQVGGYPAGAATQTRAVPASQGMNVDEDDVGSAGVSEEGDDRDEETGEMPGMG